MTLRWTRDHDEKLRELWQTGMIQTAIAEILGFSAPYISMKAAMLDLPPRHADHSLDEACRDYLEDEAAKRGIRTFQLRKRLLRIILEEKLIDAVLDDGV